MSTAPPVRSTGAGSTNPPQSRQPYGRPPVRIRIDRLIIDGVDGRPAEQLAEAFIAELRRLTRANARPARPAGGDLYADPDRDPIGAGRLIAASVHARLLGGWDV